jgi:hypothetical protein
LRKRIAEGAKIFAKDRREETRFFILRNQALEKPTTKSLQHNDCLHPLNRYNFTNEKHFKSSDWSSASLRVFDQIPLLGRSVTTAMQHLPTLRIALDQSKYNKQKVVLSAPLEKDCIHNASSKQ